MKVKINEKALDKLAQSAVKKQATKCERDLAALARSHRGKPISTIKPKVRAIFKKHSGSIDDRTLDAYSQKINEGARFEFQL